MRGTIRIYQTIHAEIAVIRILTEIAAVEIFRTTVNRLSHIYRVVTPLPDESACKVRVFVNELAIIRNISGAVAHCVNILALKERLFILRI